MKLGPSLRKRFTNFYEIVRRFSGILDRILWLTLDPSKYTIIRNKNIKKILVVLVNEEKGNVGGDFCVLGALNYFKKCYPAVEVSILADKNTKKAFGEVPGIEVIEYLGAETLRDIRGKKYNAAIIANLGPIKVNQLLFIPYRVSIFSYSFRDLLSLRTKLFITRRPFVPWGAHIAEMQFIIFQALGFKFKEKKLIFNYSKDEEKKVDSFLKKNKIKKFIVMHPGGKFVVETLQRNKWPPHLWPINRYSEVADYFSNKGYKILVTGTKKETILAKDINKNSEKGIIDCCGKFSVRELGPLLKKAKVLIATDTSIVHIAYQVGVPIVELIGPSCPEIVGAWPNESKKHRILVDNGPCARSMKKIECPEDIICLENIKVKDVIGAAEQLLKQYT